MMVNKKYHIVLVDVIDDGDAQEAIVRRVFCLRLETCSDLEEVTEYVPGVSHAALQHLKKMPQLQT